MSSDLRSGRYMTTRDGESDLASIRRGTRARGSLGRTEPAPAHMRHVTCACRMSHVSGPHLQRRRSHRATSVQNPLRSSRSLLPSTLREHNRFRLQSYTQHHLLLSGPSLDPSPSASTTSPYNPKDPIPFNRLHSVPPSSLFF